jgi:Holliday junction DNA helicase RuvA
MIDYIKGKLVSKKPGLLIIEANGIGYNINATLPAIEALGTTGDDVSIITHLQIRENPFSIVLYGFCNERERECFRQIIAVSGIGPKSALGILSAINYNELIDLISKGNYMPLTSIPGVGKKTAERLALELKDKIGKFESETQIVSGEKGKLGELGKVSEIISALISLGYNRLEADKLVRPFSGKEGFMEMQVEDIIREILRGK